MLALVVGSRYSSRRYPVLSSSRHLSLAGLSAQIEVRVIHLTNLALHITSSHGQVSHRLWPRRKNNLVINQFHNLQLFLAPFRLRCDLTSPHHSQRFGKLLHFPCKALVASNVQVDRLHPICVRWGTVVGVVGEDQTANGSRIACGSGLGSGSID